MPRRLVALACLPGLLLTACAGGSQQPEPATPASAIPASWLERTAEGWPESAGYGASAPVLNTDDCVVTDDVAAHGATARADYTGWGPYGSDHSAADAYRYLCQFRGDALSAQLQIVQTASATDANETVSLFLAQKTTKDQTNSATTVPVGDVDVHVNMRWYPKTESGEASALFHDAQAKALVQLEVSSLDAASFATYTPQQVATDLMLELARD